MFIIDKNEKINLRNQLEIGWISNDWVGSRRFDFTGSSYDYRKRINHRKSKRKSESIRLAKRWNKFIKNENKTYAR